MDDSTPKTDQLIVQGAGKQEINGTYKLVGIHNGGGVYCKEGEFWIFAFGQDQHQASASWTISKKAPSYVGYDQIHYYILRDVPVSSLGRPPLTSTWEVFHNEGAAPAPTLWFRPYNQASTANPEQPSPILKSVTLAYKTLLDSDDFADVKLVCDDGISIPAHKCLLAASSSYFKAAFSGPWQENQSGELQVNHTSGVVKAVLSMMYTGIVDSEAIKENPAAFIVIASEFDLPWLMEIAEQGCSKWIRVEILKDVWQAARLFDRDELKQDCLDFAKKNAAEVLADGKITTLMNDDPASWQEFSQGIFKKPRVE